MNTNKILHDLRVLIKLNSRLFSSQYFRTVHLWSCGLNPFGSSICCGFISTILSASFLFLSASLISAETNCTAFCKALLCCGSEVVTNAPPNGSPLFFWSKQRWKDSLCVTTTALWFSNGPSLGEGMEGMECSSRNGKSDSAVLQAAQRTWPKRAGIHSPWEAASILFNSSNGI